MEYFNYKWSQIKNCISKTDTANFLCKLGQNYVTLYQIIPILTLANLFGIHDL